MWIHCEVPPNRKERQFGPENLTDQIHIRKDSSVTGKVGSTSVLGCQYVTGRLTPVKRLVAVLYRTAVEGVRHRQLHETEIYGAALVHSYSVLGTFFLEETSRLEDRYDFRRMFLRDWQNIIHVIKMGMGDCN